MPPQSFLPHFPDALNVLTATGLILIIGVLGSRLLARVLPVPAITGYVLTGLLLGPGVLNLIDAPTLNKLALLVDLALGLVLFELGRRVDYSWLLREKRLLITGVAVSLCTFVALYLMLTAFGIGSLIASMAAALGMATSPAVVLNVVRENKAEGQLTERMLNITVIGNALAFVGFSMALSALHLEYQAGWHSYLLHPLYLLVGSILLGWLASRLLLLLGHFLGHDGQAHLILMLALIAATVGIATMFELSALIALLAFGVASRSRSRSRIVIEPDFGQFTAVLYVLLFVYAGAKLELSYMIDWAPVIVGFIVVRFAVMTLLTTSLAPANGISLRKGALLGLALTPLSGFKIVLVQHAAGYYPQFGTQLATLIVSILVIVELIGPICTRFALILSGEARTPQGKA